jgi:hypothetical protein
MKKLLFITLAVTSIAARAEFLSGNELLSQLDGESYSERGFALGYIAGVADAVENVLVCAPTSVTTGQMRDIVWKYLRANPQSRHFTASSLVVEALRKVWPCRRGTGV